MKPTGIGHNLSGRMLPTYAPPVYATDIARLLRLLAAMGIKP